MYEEYEEYTREMYMKICKFANYGYYYLSVDFYIILLKWIKLIN